MFPSRKELFRLQHMLCLKIEQNMYFCVSVCGSVSLIINACRDPLLVGKQGASQNLQPSQDKLSQAGAIPECCLCLQQDPWRVASGYWGGGAGHVAMDDGWGMVVVLRLSSHASPNTSLPLCCLQVLRLHALLDAWLPLNIFLLPFPIIF